MKQFENFDDDNLAQIGDSIYYHSGHVDTVINNKHVIVDTFMSKDVLIIEKQTFDKEIEIIEKLINRPDFGQSAVSVFIVAFVLYSVWRKWNCKKTS